LNKLKRLYHDIFRYYFISGLWLTGFDYPGTESEGGGLAGNVAGFSNQFMGVNKQPIY
jgi:hypothetical protein